MFITSGTARAARFVRADRRVTSRNPERSKRSVGRLGAKSRTDAVLVDETSPPESPPLAVARLGLLA